MEQNSNMLSKQSEDFAENDSATWWSPFSRIFISFRLVIRDGEENQHLLAFSSLAEHPNINKCMRFRSSIYGAAWGSGNIDESEMARNIANRILIKLVLI